MENIKKPMSLGKRVALSLGIGATTGVAAKLVLGKRMVDNYVPITDENINSTVLGQAIQQKWAEWASYKNIDLSTQSGWLDLNVYFRELGQDVLAKNSISDYYYVANLTTGKVPYAQLINNEELGAYISTQDPTERIADHISDTVTDQIAQAVSNAFFDKWGIELDASDYDFGLKALDLNDGAKIDELMDDYTIAQVWTGSFSRESMDDFIDKWISNPQKYQKEKGFSEMTDAEMGDAVTQIASDSLGGLLQHNGYSGEQLLLSVQKQYEVNNTPPYSTAYTIMEGFKGYCQGKAFKENMYENMDFSDLVQHFGSTGDLDVVRSLLGSERSQILSSALEEKYNLDDDISWYYTNRKTTQGMDEQTKKEYIDNFLDCGANVYSIRNTKPNSTIDEQISALGVRSQIDEMIANGDTVNIPVEQGLNDTQCGGLAGIGTLASFSVLTAVYCVRKHKLEKMIKSSPEAAANYQEYVNEESAKKEAKRAKKHHKGTEQIVKQAQAQQEATVSEEQVQDENVQENELKR